MSSAGAWEHTVEGTAPEDTEPTADWEIRHDATSGEAYYVNIHTGEATWEAPAILLPELASRSESGAHQWTEALDESGRVYYVNLHTMETRWDPPPGFGGVAVGAEAAGSKRPSTAEQMEKLNRLLSGDDDDGEGEGGEMEKPAASHPEEVSLDPLPAPAPGLDMPWMMFLNESDGTPYYYNNLTGDCVWEPPEEFVAYHQKQHAAAELPQASHGESEAEIGQWEVAQSDLESAAAASARPALRLEASITPELEDKVKRAIASVSKTPVGSSRVLLVRTPSEKWPEFTANEEHHAPGTPTVAALNPSTEGDKQSENTSEGIPTSGRPRSSRPGSALSSSSRPRTPQGIRETSAFVGLDQPPVGNEEATEFRSVNPPDEVLVLPELVEPPPCKLVESYDPETGTFLHTAEPLDSSVPSLHQDQIEVDSNSASPEAKMIAARTQQLRVEEAALVIECMVRCFLARRRVQKKRSEKLQRPAQGNLEPSVSAGSTRREERSGEIVSTTDEFPIASNAESGQEIPPVSRPDSEDGMSAVASGDASAMTSPQEEEVSAELSVTHPVDRTTDPLSSHSAQAVVASSRPDETGNGDEAEDSMHCASTAPLGNGSPTIQQNHEARVAELLPPEQEVEVEEANAGSQSPAPQVLDVARHFQRRARRPVPSPMVSDADTKQQSTAVASIVRKKIELPATQVRPASTLTDAARQQRDGKRKQAANAAKAQRQATLAQELAGYRQLYEASVVKYQTEKKQVTDTYFDKRHKAADEARKTESPNRAGREEVVNARNESASLWQFAGGLPGSGDAAQLFEAGLAKVLDPETFASAMHSERLFSIEQRIDRLHSSNQHLETQLEGIDMHLVSEDPEHEASSSAPSAAAAQKTTFQVKYASKLRRAQKDLLDAIAFWQQQVENVSGNSPTKASHYWSRVDEHYNKFAASADHIQDHILHAFRNASGDSLLHLAAWNGRLDAVARLIALGADVNMIDNTVSRWTPLHEACRGGHTEIARLLLSSGAKLDAVDTMGDSPLHIACRLGWSRLVHLLLTVAEEREDPDAPEAASSGGMPMASNRKAAAMSCTLIEFFGLRNCKKRRAMDLAKLSSLLAYLQRKLEMCGVSFLQTELAAC